jgi:hypothetical protein
MHHEMQCFFAATEVLWVRDIFGIVGMWSKSYLIAAHSEVVR